MRGLLSIDALSGGTGLTLPHRIILRRPDGKDYKAKIVRAVRNVESRP
jgi:hypothetical protein